MIINFKATSIELNETLRAYTTSKLALLDKVLLAGENRDAGLATVELARTTKHHKHGDVFRAEVNLNWSGQHWRAEVESNDLYAAIDEMKDELVQEVKSWRKRQGTIFRRGARVLKNWLQSGK